MCQSCGEEPETTSHILLHCPTAIHTWGQSPIRAIVPNKQSGFKEVCANLLESLPREGGMLFAILAWQIWKARNQWIFESVPLNPRETVRKSLKLFQEVRAAEMLNNIPLRQQKHPAKWSPPPEGMLKLNSDVAVFGNGEVGFGFVLRNSEGNILMAESRRCLGEGTSTFSEALALRYALRQTIDWGLHNIMVEMDSEILANMLKSGNLDNSYTSVIIEDIWAIAKEISCAIFDFVKRDANFVAHKLAHFGSHVDFEEIWIEEIPDCCNDALLRDVRREPILV